MKDLLGLGADPSHQLYWSEGWTTKRFAYPPLHVACMKGSIEIAKMLVNAGADVNRCEPYSSKTPLHFACEEAHQQMVDYLIREAGYKVGEFSYCSSVLLLSSVASSIA